MTGENIIVFSGDDWASGLKTSKYHVSCRLARENRVLYINSIGMRAPSASRKDISRVFKKLLGFFRGAVRAPEGLLVYTPIVIPFARQSGLVKFLNRMLLRAMLRWLQFRYKLKHPIVFVFMPLFNDVLGRLGEKAIVYYCIDDLKAFPGVHKEAFLREENRLLALADCVISCSQELHDDFVERGYESHYMPHGVNWKMFRKAVDEDLELPEDLRNIPGPRIGFYGYLTDEWVDFGLLNHMAKKHPDWHIVLIGNLRAGMDINAAAPADNMHYLGLKPFTSLPSYTRHFDVGIIPFVLDRIAIACNPLKMLEYLAGGLPVVCIDIPEARKLEGLVRVAATHDEFIAQCAAALKETDAESRRKRSDAISPRSWDARVNQICELVTQTSARKNAP